MNPTTSGQALTNLQQYQSGMQTPDQSLQNADQSLGVNQAQQQVSGLRGAIQNTTNLLNQVAPSVYGRTQNSLVTDAQATGQINNAEAPLNSQLNTENTNYSNANSDYTNLEQQAEAQASAEQTGQNNQLSALQNIYSDLYTQESNAAQQAEAEREFNAQQATANAAASSDNGLGSELSSLLGGSSSNIASMSGISSAKPGSFQFNSNGSPISGYNWATANGVDPVALLSYMASKGDSNATNAINDIKAANGITPAIEAKYNGFF